MIRTTLPFAAIRRALWDGARGPRIPPEQVNDIVATAADLAMVVDRTGKVRSVVVNPLNATIGRLDHWQDRDIREFTAPDSVGKLERRLATPTEGPQAIEINHHDNADWDFPIRYTLHPIDPDGTILMLGRDLRPIAELQHRLVKAQLALERDYEGQRDYETRYRVVLEAARAALVLVEVETGRVLDANGAAARLFGATAADLAGGAFTQEFEGRRRSEFLDALVAAAQTEAAPPVAARTRRGGTDVTMIPTLFRASGDRMLLVRVEPAGHAGAQGDALSPLLDALFRQGPDAMVFCDEAGVVRLANDAFLSLLDAGALKDVRGRSLSDFLSRGSVDLKVLLDTAQRSGAMRVYATRLETAVGGQVSVEISAAHLGTGGGFAFVLRDVSRMEVVRDTSAGPLLLPGAPVSDDAMRNVMDLVGSAPLREIVAATTDVVEKMCIETAVELTGNNRVAAAEMLGLSRQSLYVKLRKYGLLRRGDG